jgi:hypothetical protein
MGVDKTPRVYRTYARYMARSETDEQRLHFLRYLCETVAFEAAGQLLEHSKITDNPNVPNWFAKRAFLSRVAVKGVDLALSCFRDDDQAVDAVLTGDEWE